MRESILLVGGGGHCKSCIDVIEQEGRFAIAGIVDFPEKVAEKVLGYPVLGTDEDLPDLVKSYPNVLITLGQIKFPARRIELFEELQSLGAQSPVIQSPLAYVSPHAQIGEGTIIMHRALINAGAQVGRNCIINTKALVEHDAVIEDHCHIDTGAIVYGETNAKNGAFIGSNATCRDNLSLAEKSVMGGGHKNASHSHSKHRTRLRIGYFGDGLWAQNALKLFLDDPQIDVRFLVARYKAPDVRLIELARESDITILKSSNVNSNDFLQNANKFDCDLFVSMSFDQIFKSKIINLPPLKTINCHAGKLPFYRGRNVLNWVLINDENDFGITVHYVDEGIDTGDIILQETYPITDNDNYATLLSLAHIECSKLLYEGVRLIQNGQARPNPQNAIHPFGMYCTGRTVGDEILNWNMKSREVFNFVRAICEPGPMAVCWAGAEKVFINRVELVGGALEYKGIPGAVLSTLSDRSVLVKTNDSYVKVVDYRKAGRPLRTGVRLRTD